jgi:hypothetical protein
VGKWAGGVNSSKCSKCSQWAEVSSSNLETQTCVRAIGRARAAKTTTSLAGFADEHTPPWLPNNSVLHAYFPLFLSGTRATDAQAPSQQAFQQLQRTAQVTTSAVFVSIMRMAS